MSSYFTIILKIAIKNGDIPIHQLWIKIFNNPIIKVL